MFKRIFMITALLLPLTANAAELKVTLGGTEKNTRVPEKFAYCKYSPAKNEHELTQNISPAISWSEGPLGTKSYALIVVDEDVPADFAPANKEGKTIPVDAKRRPFYHWGLVGISGQKLSLGENVAKDNASIGVQTGNDFGNVGYDGPCPPWNDELVHKYRFQVFALDADLNKLNIASKIHTKEVLKAIAPYILAQGETVVNYSTNPNVK